MGTKPVLVLTVHGKNGMLRFAEIVGSNIERKLEKLRSMAASYQPPGWQARNWRKAVVSRYPHLAGDVS